MRRTLLPALGAIVALAAAAACVRPAEKPGEAPPVAPGTSEYAVAVVRPGAPVPAPPPPVVVAEIAAKRPERERGLSGRDTLGADAGMLFVYAEPNRRRFWMKDCRIGLDIAFLANDGRIVRLATLPPGEGLRGEAIPAVDCPESSRFVLETNAGWFERHGVRRGDRVDVRAAVEGVLPE